MTSSGPSTYRFEGKVAIVTGGTSGIGRGIVERLRAEGAAVAFTGRNIQRGEDVANATGATFVPADASCADHAVRTLDAVLARFGTVHFLVNNAGDPGRMQGVEHLSPDLFEQAFAVHVRAPWELTGLVVPIMRRAGGGSVVNIASIAGQRVGPVSMLYSTSKAALLHFTRCAAAELGKHAIRVNSVSPSYIALPDRANASGPDNARLLTAGLEQAAVITSRQALPRLGRVRDVVETVMFLLSDQSSFLTGSDVVVDGGTIWGKAE